MANIMSKLSPAGQTAANLLLGAGIGVPVGVLGALLKRKFDSEMEIQSPTEYTNIPVLQERGEKKRRRKIEPTSKKAALTVGNTVGVLGGAGVTYKVLNKLFNRRDEKMLDAALHHRENKLNRLLVQEQAAATGIPSGTAITVKRSADSRVIEDALFKIASDLYDGLEKQGDMPLRDLIAGAKRMLMLDTTGAQLAIPAAGIGLLGVFGYTRANDPNTMRAKAVKDALRERLTGKDRLISPMPIRVESDRPVLKPLRPGVSSLSDPSKGRDILMGI